MKKLGSFGFKRTRKHACEHPETERLAADVERLTKAFHYHQKESARKSEEIAHLCRQIDELKLISLTSRAAPKSGKDNAKSFNTLLKLCGGMAIAVYGFNADDKRSRIVAEIQNDLDLKGINLDADTIRKYLKQSAELLKTEEEQEALMK